ncbi:hypothetical protein [Paracoccus cavernae]|uniref:hypothetical protein n=1 Tax=Paracoccus cavernae TaxID=1571207 RepID=UPI0035F2624B
MQAKIPRNCRTKIRPNFSFVQAKSSAKQGFSANLALCKCRHAWTFISRISGAKASESEVFHLDGAHFLPTNKQLIIGIM